MLKFDPPQSPFTRGGSIGRPIGRQLNQNKMKTKNIHKSLLPSTAFGGPCVEADRSGFVVWHDDAKYASMSVDDLYGVIDSKGDVRARNAAEIELVWRTQGGSGKAMQMQ